LTSALSGGVPAALTQGKAPRYSMDRKLGGAQSKSCYKPTLCELHTKGLCSVVSSQQKIN